ncbi:MAG: hypothetical protein M1819_007017 [Sarea resinae]|nr:MAG: hypothetical protein M1819_007017 [Sarea resinae]
MAPLSYTHFSSSPVLALPRQHAPHHLADVMASSPITRTSPFDHASFSATPTRVSPKPIAPFTNPSRKRSRDETLSPVDAQPAASYFDRASTHSSSATTVINGMNTGPSQPRKISFSRTNPPDHITLSSEHPRPVITPRKSQRLDLAAASSASISSISTGSPPKSGTPTDPFANDFTLVLGIGWTRLSDDESMQAAARGWAKYIENHYPLSDANILLRSNGLNSYLVRATQGFFLFSDDLSEGRFVGATWEKALPNLQARPVVFEGDVLRAVRSPILQPAKNDGSSDVPEQTHVAADGHHAMDLD